MGPRAHGRKPPADHGDALTAAAELAELEAAMTCSCGALRAIVESGVVCPQGCGRILPFTSLAIVQVTATFERGRAIESLLRRTFPGQIVRWTPAEIAGGPAARPARKRPTREETEAAWQRWRELYMTPPTPTEVIE